MHPNPEGTDGPEGSDGLGDRESLEGRDGLKSRDGPEGSDGLAGSDGLKGRDGLVGSDGLESRDGLGDRESLEGRDGLKGRENPVRRKIQEGGAGRPARPETTLNPLHKDSPICFSHHCFVPARLIFPQASTKTWSISANGLRFTAARATSSKSLFFGSKS